MSARTSTSPGKKRTPRAGAKPVPPETAEAEARRHRRTRDAHSSERAEDYVEVIADLLEQDGEARAVDIARRLGVSHVTVIKTVARLQKNGLVTTRPYRSIFLTDNGERLAKEVRRRHRIVVEFLLTLGVRSETAWTDAEGIEHHVSAETLEAFQQFTRDHTRDSDK